MKPTHQEYPGQLSAHQPVDQATAQPGVVDFSVIIGVALISWMVQRAIFSGWLGKIRDRLRKKSSPDKTLLR